MEVTFSFRGRLRMRSRFSQPVRMPSGSRGAPAAEGLALRRQGNHEVVVSDPEIRRGLCCGGATGFLQQEGMFWRRTLWERAGALDIGLRLAANYELRIRFARETDLVRLTIPLAALSYHETNRSIVERDAILSACLVFPRLQPILKAQRSRARRGGSQALEGGRDFRAGRFHRSFAGLSRERSCGSLFAVDSTKGHPRFRPPARVSREGGTVAPDAIRFRDDSTVPI